jgi:hypothetical protein
MAVNIRELLHVTSEQVERPKPLPSSHYVATITNHEFTKTRSQAQTDVLRFFFKISRVAEDGEANPDVMTQLEGVDLGRTELRKDFFLTPRALYRLSDFVDAVLGKETGRMIDDRIPETRGAHVLINVSQRPANDGSDTVYNDVLDVTPA